MPVTDVGKVAITKQERGREREKEGKVSAVSLTEK